MYNFTLDPPHVWDEVLKKQLFGGKSAEKHLIIGQTGGQPIRSDSLNKRRFLLHFSFASRLRKRKCTLNVLMKKDF